MTRRSPEEEAARRVRDVARVVWLIKKRWKKTEGQRERGRRQERFLVVSVARVSMCDVNVLALKKSEKVIPPGRIRSRTTVTHVRK